METSCKIISLWFTDYIGNAISVCVSVCLSKCTILISLLSLECPIIACKHFNVNLWYKIFITKLNYSMRCIATAVSGYPELVLHWAPLYTLAWAWGYCISVWPESVCGGAVDHWAESNSVWCLLSCSVYVWSLSSFLLWLSTWCHPCVNIFTVYQNSTGWSLQHWCSVHPI